MNTLYDKLTPEIVSRLGKGAPRDENALLRTDWNIDVDFEDSVDMATPNLDAWGSLYYLVCDFNNDGQIPNPEVLTNPPKAGAETTLKQRLAIFSAGPDGDPATWKDNIPSCFSK